MAKLAPGLGPELISLAKASKALDDLTNGQGVEAYMKTNSLRFAEEALEQRKAEATPRTDFMEYLRRIVS